MWRNFRFICMTDVKNFKISPHDQCAKISNFSTSDISVENVSKNVQFMLFCCKISFVAIYTVLSRNQFCCNLRTSVWRKF